MQQAVQACEEAFEAIGEQRTKLREYAEETQSQWQGNAAKVFHQVIETFDEKFEAIGQQLSDLSEKIGGAAMKYEQAEEENAQAANNIASMLNF